MSIRDRIRAWLGLDDVPSLTMFKAMEQKQKERHDLLLEDLRWIRFNVMPAPMQEANRQRLERIEQRMINEHIGATRVFASPVLDWDTVQAMTLAELEREPQPKEM